MSTAWQTRGVAAAAAAVLAGATLAGCGLLSEPAAVPACGWLDSVKPAADAGHTVVLLDRSASSRGADAPDYVAALRKPVTAAVEAHDVVSIGTFDGSAASVRWTAEDLVTDRGRANPQNRRDDDETATRCVLAELTKAGSLPASVPGSDVIGALHMGGQAMRDEHGIRRIVLATDGLATTGCADLSRVRAGDRGVIDEIEHLCRSQAPNRDDLTGVGVTLLGIGHPAAGRPQPSTLQLDWLGSLWSTLCRDRTGSACDVSTAAVPRAGHDLTGQDDAEPASPDDPVLRFPPAETGVDDDGATRFQLDTSVLFAPNEWVITSAGESSLSRVAANIRREGAARISVDGYTEAEASPDANRTLAQHRADAVSGFLRRHGVTVHDSTGHSDIPPGCAPDDRSCKRRVDIVATHRPHETG